MKSGNLYFLEPSVPPQACNRTAFMKYNEECMLKTCTFFGEHLFSPLYILNDFNYIFCLLDFVLFELAEYCSRLLHTPTPSVHQFYGQWTGTQSKAARPTSCRSAPCYTGTWESGAGCKESEQKGIKLQTTLVCIAPCLWSFLHQRCGNIFTKKKKSMETGVRLRNIPKWMQN
jgi:hypothetical protein